METSGNNIDRASWKRYTSKGGRCLVCGNRAVVTVGLSATEITSERGGTALTKETLTFCDVHGIDRYGMALRVLQTGIAREGGK